MSAAEGDPAASAVGRLVMLVGPPASGKSYLARQLAERLDGVLLQSDALRKAMFKPPRYTGREHNAVYSEAHRRIARALRQGQTVIFDATNLEERTRRVIYAIADQAAAGLIIARTYAPPDLVQRRLVAREAGLDPLDQSDADLAVLQRSKRPGPIGRPHFLINTAVGLSRAIELIEARAKKC